MKVDPGSVVPIFTQIVNEMQSAIAAGVFREGERIPSARELAQRLTVNPNTVQKAYAELVELGVVESRRGLGKFVAKRGSSSALKQSEESVAALCEQAIILGRSAGILDRRLKQIFSEALTSAPKMETA